MMKYLFFCLVLLNLLFFLWNHRMDLAPMEQLRDDVNSEQIVLRGEFSESLAMLHAKKQMNNLLKPQMHNQFDYHGEDLNNDYPSISESYFIDQKLFSADKFELIGDNSVELIGVNQLIELLTAYEKPQAAHSKEESEDVADVAILKSEPNEADQKQLPEERPGRQQVVLQQEPECYQVGPFQNQKKLNAWLNKRKIQDKAEIIKRLEQEFSSYLVYYPAGETYQQSKANEQLLRKKGVKNLWLFRSGEMKGIISLGLFKQKYRAERMVSNYLNKGIDVKLMKRFNDVERFYAQINNIKEQELIIESPLKLSDCGRP